MTPSGETKPTIAAALPLDVERWATKVSMLTESRVSQLDAALEFSHKNERGCSSVYVRTFPLATIFPGPSMSSAGPPKFPCLWRFSRARYQSVTIPSVKDVNI